jgi:two-component system sensor histidine kinase UhpB
MRRMPLLVQVLLANLLLVSVAVVAAALVANPDVDVRDEPGTGLVLAFAIALTLLVNVFVIQRRFDPLERIIEEMETADLSGTGAGFDPEGRRGGSQEVARLEQALARMLARLEAERRRASSAALEAQERERARVARDLHDEVNQSLTAVLLRLEAAREKAPPILAAELAQTKAVANSAMQELLDLATQLRPTALDDLGLRAALAGLTETVGRQAGVEARFSSEGTFTDLGSDVQLVVYRVAQEALTNAVRHSGAGAVDVRLRRGEGWSELTVADDGAGFAEQADAEGLGLTGMRERAMLIGARLEILSPDAGGTLVRLEV